MNIKSSNSTRKETMLSGEELAEIFFFYSISFFVTTIVKYLCYYWDESRFCQIRYRGSRWNAFKACMFEPKRTFIVPLMCFVVSLLLMYPDGINVFNSEYIHVCFLGTIASVGTFWKRNKLDLPEELANTPVGAGFALSAYFTYYSRCIPEIQKNIRSFEEDRNITVSLRKLIIVVPKSCGAYTNTVAVAEDEDIEFVSNLPDIEVNIYGTKWRIFKNTVYKIRTLNEADEPLDIYCVVEGTSAHNTLASMQERGLLDSTELQEQIWLYYRKLEELLSKDDACRGKYILVPFDDVSADGQLIMLSSVLKGVIRRATRDNNSNNLALVT